MRLIILVVASVICFPLTSFAQEASVASVIEDLVAANRILAAEGILPGYGMALRNGWGLMPSCCRVTGAIQSIQLPSVKRWRRMWTTASRRYALFITRPQRVRCQM